MPKKNPAGRPKKIAQTPRTEARVEPILLSIPNFWQRIVLAFMRGTLLEARAVDGQRTIITIKELRGVPYAVKVTNAKAIQPRS